MERRDPENAGTSNRKRSSSVQKALDNPLLPLVEVKNNSATKAALEKKVRRYFHQLTVGCLQACDHKLCASNLNAPTFSAEIAGVMAVQLATNPRPLFCPRMPLEPPIQANFTLSPFGTPHSSPPVSRAHSRQSSASFGAEKELVGRARSTSNLQKGNPELDVVPKPFLNSLFSYPSFSAIFGEPNRSIISSLSPLHPSRSLEFKPPQSHSQQKARSNSDVKSSRLASNSNTMASNLDLQSIGADLISSQVDLEQPAYEEEKLILKYLNIDLLKMSVDAYQSVAVGEQLDSTFLVNSIHGVFSSQSALSHSFLNKDKNGHISNLNLESIVESYNLINSMQPHSVFQKSLDHALEILLSKMYLRVKQNRNPEQNFLRILIIVVLYPAFQETALNESLLKKLCCVFGKIRSQTNATLISWFSRLSPQMFTQILTVFKKYVVAVGPPSKPTEDFIGAIKTMSLLSHANEYQTYAPIIPYSEFYIPELGAKLNFKEEFRKWKKTFESNNVTEFAFFNYPFLFDPVAKTRIMHIDAMVKMSLEYEDAYVNQALVMHAKRFLEDSEVMKNFEMGMKESANPYVVLEVRRNHLVKDVLDQISRKTAELKKPLKIMFVGGGEEGMDQGGVQKEFFQVLISELLDPLFGMFDYDPETRFSWISRSSLEPVSQFELVGTILGLALYNGVIIRVSFPPLMYKKLLNEEITLEDFEVAFPTLGKGLRGLLEWKDGDVEDVFCRTFEISYEIFGKIQHIPLIPGGSEIVVSNANRDQYVKMFIKHYVYTSVNDRFIALQQGFYNVCGGRSLAMCRPTELELLLCGTTVDDSDFLKLQQGAGYDDGYTASHNLIQYLLRNIRWFWEIVHAMEITHKKRLLEFVTASDRVPLKGLDSLVFVIQRNGPDTDRLPTALTCFGRLLLPEYRTKEKLRERLTTAIENAKGFGLV